MPQIEPKHVEQFARLAVQRAIARWKKDRRTYATLVFAYAGGGTEPNPDPVDALPFQVVTTGATCKHGAMRLASDLASQGAALNNTHLIGVLVRPVPIGPVPLELVVEASGADGKGVRASTDLNDDMEPAGLRFEPFNSSEVLAPLFKVPEPGDKPADEPPPDDGLPPGHPLDFLRELLPGVKVFRIPLPGKPDEPNQG